MTTLDTLAFCKIKQGTKRPLGKSWQKSPLSFQEVIKEPAYGVLTGHGGFLAVDCDGPLALGQLEYLFGGLIPDTWAWSSGKDGRVQFGFFVPENLRSKLTQARYWEEMPDGSQLDFRWFGCQSILPPSPHPETGGYFWEQSPDDFDLAVAPEGLIDYAVSLKNRLIPSLVRVPAQTYAYYGAPLKIWALAMLMAKGSGRAVFSLKDAAEKLGRSLSSVRRLLARARNQGLIRNFYCQGDRCIAYPRAMLKICARANLPELGVVTEVKEKDLLNLNIFCTEAVAYDLQRRSIYAAKASQKERPPTNRQKFINPLNPAEPELRVLWSGDRFTAISEGALPFGASQSAIARLRGTCSKTIQRHLDNGYRLNPSPVKGYKKELMPIRKTQLLQRIPKRFNFLADKGNWPDEGNFLYCGDRIYLIYPNIYQFSAKISLRIRKHRKIYSFLSQTIPSRYEGQK